MASEASSATAEPTGSPPPTKTSENGTSQPAGAAPKKLHGRAFYESIGSPKYIVAPMVDQSEFVCQLFRLAILLLLLLLYSLLTVVVSIGLEDAL